MGQTPVSIRSVMKSNSDSARQIWITEFGAPTGGPDGVGQAAQATALTQAIAYAQSTSWIGASDIYSWKDDGTDPTNDEDWFGVLTAAGAQKLAYTAVVNGISRAKVRRTDELYGRPPPGGRPYNRAHDHATRIIIKRAVRGYAEDYQLRNTAPITVCGPCAPPSPSD